MFLFPVSNLTKNYYVMKIEKQFLNYYCPFKATIGLNTLLFLLHYNDQLLLIKPFEYFFNKS